MYESAIDKTAMAAKLRSLRLAMGKTVSQVSEDTGLGETAIRNYECGIRIPRYESMFALADYYKTTVDDIFFHAKDTKRVKADAG